MAEYEIKRKCKNCGKVFTVLAPSMWAYKTRSRKNGDYEYFCSWHCLREKEKKSKPKRMKVIA